MIGTTDEHPFWVEGKGWTNAGALSVGDVLRLRDGGSTIVSQISIIPQDESVIVYNFEVEDFHTYYVSEDEVLVHNATCGGHNIKDLRKLSKKKLRSLGESNILQKLKIDLEEAGQIY